MSKSDEDEDEVFEEELRRFLDGWQSRTRRRAEELGLLGG